MVSRVIAQAKGGKVDYTIVELASVPTFLSWKKVIIAGPSELVQGTRQQTLSERPDLMLIELQYSEEVARAAPLALLVSPDSLTWNRSKVLNETRARGGWVVQHWGDNLGVLEASGRSAGCYVGASLETGLLGTSESGLTRYRRFESLSWQNIQSLELAFRNNGLLFEDEETVPSSVLGDGLIRKPGMVWLSFRDDVMKGRFDTFRLTEEADHPFTVNWAFTFTIHAQDPIWRPSYVQEFKSESLVVQNPVLAARSYRIQPLPDVVMTDAELWAAYVNRPAIDSDLTFEDFKARAAGTVTQEELNAQYQNLHDRRKADVGFEGMSTAVSAEGVSLQDVFDTYDPASGQQYVVVRGTPYYIGEQTEESYAYLRQMVEG
jgi:hypothetical protein